MEVQVQLGRAELAAAGIRHGLADFR